MKNINVKKITLWVILAVIAAPALLSSCEKISVDGTLDEIAATNTTTTVHDTTLVYRDTTVFVYDTVTDTVTEVREVVIPVHDTVTVPGENHEFTLRLRQWHNRWLGVNAGYLVGEDSVVLTKYEGATLLQTWRTTAQHRGTATLSVGTNAYPTSVVGDSCWLAPYGAGLFKGQMAGNQVTLTLGTQAIVAPVMIDGFDWAPYLTAHQALGQRVRFDADSYARGYIIDADGRAAGTVTATYTTEDPQDTTRRLISADTAYTHLSTNPTGVWSSVASTLTWSCSNRRTITRHYNLAPLTETNDYNFNIGFPYQVSVSGSAVAAMLGMTVTISSGVATFTSGGYTLVVTLTALARTCTLNPIPLPCQHQLTTASLVTDGNGGYRVQINGTLEGTTTVGYVPVSATPRQEISRDTTWVNTCGQVTNTVRNGSNHTINHTIVRTGTETIHYNIAPLTETHTVSETTHYVSNYTVSGSALTSAQGTTASFTGNSVTIGGATLTITPGAQPWCTLTYVSATLTSNGLVVSFTYNGSTGSVTIPVPWNNPEPIFTSVLAAAATDSYTHQIFSLSSYRHTYVCVVAQIGTNYRFYWAELQAGLTRADFDSVSINATEANFYVNHLSDGYYPAMVYSHSDHTTLYRGVVKSEELSTGWQQTYRLAPSNSLAYVMGGSSWTMAGDNGRSAVRGIMTSTGSLSADGITVQLY